MMSSREEVRGYQGEDYVSVRLSYGADERFTMIAVLPDDMDAFIAGLDEQSFKDLTKVLLPVEDPVVNLPVLEMEQKVKLNDVLIALGMEKAFSPDEADFTEMAGADILWIDEVLHAAKITVNEEGTEAAAATSVGMTLKAMPLENFEFIADRPFLFFIMDTENELVLFTGKVMDLN
jgi:serpin B